MRRALLASLTLLCLGPVATANGSALDLFGYGARSPGLAGTGVSFLDSFDALYSNPAGLAFARRKRLSVGFVAGSYDVHAAGQKLDLDAAMGIIVGVDVPIPFGGALKDRVTLGIGLHVPPLLLSRARAPFPGDPFLVLLENRAQVVAFMVGGGVRVSKTVTVGAGAVSLAALSGGIDVSADSTKRFTSTSEQQLLIDYAPVLGARWQVMPKLSVGAVYRGVSKAPFDILVTNMIGDALPVTLPAIRVRGFSQYDPAMIEAEGSYTLARKLTVIAALAWKRWSAFPPPTEDPVIDAPERVRPGFANTFVPKLAARYYPKKGLELRAGYRLEPTPAPEQTAKENLLDNTRHILTAGAGLDIDANGVPLHLNGYFQAHFLTSRVSTKDQTLAPDERDPNYLAIGSGGRILVGGLSLGVDL